MLISFIWGVYSLTSRAHVDPLCLEDTGSTNFTLLEADLTILDISGIYDFWLAPTSTQIVEGTVQLPTVVLGLQVPSQGLGSGPIRSTFLDE